MTFEEWMHQYGVIVDLVEQGRINLEPFGKSDLMKEHVMKYERRWNRGE